MTTLRKLLIVLGVPIDDLTLPAALDRLEAFVEAGRATGKTHQIATINADFVVKALDDPELRRILQESDMATADGMPLVWGARLLGVPLDGRVTGADMVPALAGRAAAKGFSLFLLGAAPGVAQRAADVLCERFPGLTIAGVLSPPVRPLLEMDAGIVEAVRAAKPDILLVAFGNPKQEKWIAMHAHELGTPVMIGVGGTLDFLAGAVRRAPAWMQRSGLEWLFRFAQEPRRLWRRYVVDFAGFSYFFVRQWLAMRQGGAPAPALPMSDALVLGNVAVLRVRGRLDSTGVAAFSARAAAALKITPRLVVDLREAAFLDSAALGALVGLAKRAQEAGGELVLADVPPPVARVLELLRLDRFFTIRESVERALELPRAPEPPQPASGADWAVVPLPARLDGLTSPEVVTHCTGLLAANPRLVLDLGDTTFLSSAGLAAVLKLSRLAKDGGGELRLAGGRPDVLRTIQLAKFERVVPLFVDVSAATAH